MNNLFIPPQNTIPNQYTKKFHIEYVQCRYDLQIVLDINMY